MTLHQQTEDAVARAIRMRDEMRRVRGGDESVPLSHPLGVRDSGTAGQPLQTFGMREFLTMQFPAREFVLAPIIPTKGLAMIYAQRGVGKTHVGLGSAYAVASGSEFLRWRAPQARRVLYIDGEMPAQALQERLDCIAAGADAMPGEFGDALQLLPMDAQAPGNFLNLSRSDDQRRVEDLLIGTSLLVLDNLSTLVNGGRENDAESWDAMQGWLLGLRRQDVSVLLIHHAGRGDNARGTSKREDVLDTVLQLKRPEDYQPDQGARFEVHLTKARGVHGDDALPFEAKLETRDGKAVWTMRELRDVQADLVEEMTKDGMTVREIGDELGIGKSTVSRIQNKLRAEGRLP
jgi:hypothetical protein